MRGNRKKEGDRQEEKIGGGRDRWEQKRARGNGGIAEI